MKVLHVSHSDLDGGAARAAYRIHHALLEHRVDSSMYVNLLVDSADNSVHGLPSKLDRVWAKAQRELGGIITRTLRTGNPVIHSPAILPSIWPQRLNRLEADVVHLHWINFDMLSIGDVARFTKPVVWTLHDMWAFCGAEHYTDDFRWRNGYTRTNRPSYESGFDLNRWTWQRKRRQWKRPMHIVAPSRWLAECARESVLMRDWPVTVIPNPLDTSLYRPHDKSWCRGVLGLPGDVPLILFGAMGGTKSPRKGFDLLLGAVRHLLESNLLKEFHCIVFGERRPKAPPQLNIPVHWMGHISDEWTLVLLYNAADVMVVPSRQENLPQAGSEAQACGTPVVAFDCSGLPDVVSHKSTGYLAEPYSTADLAEGIYWVISDEARYHDLSLRARELAVARYSPPNVVEQYIDVYKRAISPVRI